MPADPAGPNEPRPLAVEGSAASPRTRRTTAVLASPRSAPARVEEHSDQREYRLRRILAFTDVAGLIAAFAATMLLRSLGERPDLGLDELLVFAAGVPLWVGLALLLGLYHLPERRLDHSFADEVGPIVLTATVWSWILLCGRAVISAQPIEVAASLLVWGTSIVAILVLRAIVRQIARRGSWYRQSVAVAAGNLTDLARIVRRIERHPEYGLDVYRELDLSLPETERELVDLVRARAVHRVVIANLHGDLEARSEFIRLLLESGVHVDLVSSETDVFSSKAVLHFVEGLPVVTFPVVRQAQMWKSVKRWFDVTAASAGLLALSPLLAYAAMRIKLDSPGPILYRQSRIGQRGEPFEMWKFRTMVTDADDRKHEVAALNFHADNGEGLFKIERDPRVTKFGAWLRRWSIDELPQLWQVVRGDMSLVGPRPLIHEEARLVGGHYVVRAQMRPGMTGPWQTLGRSDIGFDDMVKLDYTYVVNWSFAEDVRLLLRTLETVVQGRGAY